MNKTIVLFTSDFELFFFLICTQNNDFITQKKERLV